MSEIVVKISSDLTIDIKKSKNVLVAGRAGSGKSIFLHKVINGLINEPKENLREFLIDFKDTELSIYEKGAEKLAAGEFLYLSPETQGIEKCKVERV